MSNDNFAHENTPASAFGEFIPDFQDQWTDQEWREYDAQVAAEIAAWEAGQMDDYIDLDPEPPF